MGLLPDIAGLRREGYIVGAEQSARIKNLRGGVKVPTGGNAGFPW